ncbi:MAG: hypothetical protein J2O48_09035 [Solirubrobacterales bacterium]|nr:hypothetical protein [Solirubrobacterales bacterium]
MSTPSPPKLYWIVVGVLLPVANIGAFCAKLYVFDGGNHVGYVVPAVVFLAEWISASAALRPRGEFTILRSATTLAALLIGTVIVWVVLIFATWAPDNT